MGKSDTELLDWANSKRKLSKHAALDKTLQLLNVNSTISPADIASQIGRSRQTVYDYLGELEMAGRIRRNGNGVQIIA